MWNRENNCEFYNTFPVYVWNWNMTQLLFHLLMSTYCMWLPSDVLWHVDISLLSLIHHYFYSHNNVFTLVLWEWKSSHHLITFMSLETHLTFLLQWNSNEKILKNILVLLLLVFLPFNYNEKELVLLNIKQDSKAPYSLKVLCKEQPEI